MQGSSIISSIQVCWGVASTRSHMRLRERRVKPLARIWFRFPRPWIDKPMERVHLHTVIQATDRSNERCKRTWNDGRSSVGIEHARPYLVGLDRDVKGSFGLGNGS